MGLPGGVSPLFPVGFLVVLVGDVLHLIGLATPEWSIRGTQAKGLFHMCNGGICYLNDYTGMQYSAMNECIRAAAAMNVIGALFGLAAFKMALIHWAMGCLGKGTGKIVPLLGGVVAAIAFCFILIGVAVWGGAVHDNKLNEEYHKYDIGYSFALSISGGILLLLGGLLMMAGSRSTETSGSAGSRGSADRPTP